MTKLLAEVKAAGNVILVIDEVHTLVGAGSVSRGGGGGLDIANLLKPALARWAAGWACGWGLAWMGRRRAGHCLSLLKPALARWAAGWVGGRACGWGRGQGPARVGGRSEVLEGGK